RVARPAGSCPSVPSPAPWVPTIMDHLDAAQLSWRIYGGLPEWSICPSFTECVYGPGHRGVVSNQQVFGDAARGALPNLAIVIPFTGRSQHNGDSMLRGDNCIRSVVGAIENSPEG